jgi:hypothetical protein
MALCRGGLWSPSPPSPNPSPNHRIGSQAPGGPSVHPPPYVHPLIIITPPAVRRLSQARRATPPPPSFPPFRLCPGTCKQTLRLPCFRTDCPAPGGGWTRSRVTPFDCAATVPLPPPIPGLHTQGCGGGGSCPSQLHNVYRCRFLSCSVLRLQSWPDCLIDHRYFSGFAPHRPCHPQHVGHVAHVVAAACKKNQPHTFLPTHSPPPRGGLTRSHPRSYKNTK